MFNVKVGNTPLDFNMLTDPAKTVEFCRGSTEFVRLLGYYEAWADLKPTFRDYLSVPSNHLTPRNNPEYGRIQD